MLRTIHLRALSVSLAGITGRGLRWYNVHTRFWENRSRDFRAGVVTQALVYASDSAVIYIDTLEHACLCTSVQSRFVTGCMSQSVDTHVNNLTPVENYNVSFIDIK
jgi:hypothetical protein